MLVLPIVGGGSTFIEVIRSELSNPKIALAQTQTDVALSHNQCSLLFCSSILLLWLQIAAGAVNEKKSPFISINKKMQTQFVFKSKIFYSFKIIKITYCMRNLGFLKKIFILKQTSKQFNDSLNNWII